MKLLPLTLCALVGLVGTACRKPAAPSAADTPAPSVPSMPEKTNGSASGAFAPHIAAAAMAPFQKDLESDSPDSHLRALNAALTFWLAAGRPFPKDLKQLAVDKLITHVPTPPPGKQFVLDPASSQVLLKP